MERESWLGFKDILSVSENINKKNLTMIYVKFFFDYFLVDKKFKKVEEDSRNIRGNMSTISAIRGT